MNGCTPKYPDGFDANAKTEAGRLRLALPHSHEEDMRKFLRLNIWPFLSDARYQIYRSDSTEL